MEQFLPRLMEQNGFQGLLEQRKNSGEVPTETVPWWWWVHQEPSLPLRMVLHGLQGLREQQMNSIGEHTETVRLLWWVIMQRVLEPFSLHQMEPHGLQELLELHTISLEESPTQTVPS